jgi:hypothetical protein
MGSIEAVSAVVNEAELLVVAEDVQPGVGFPYTSILAGLRDNPAQSVLDVARAMVDGIMKKLHPGTQVAVLSSDGLREVAAELVALVQDLGPMEGDTLTAVSHALAKGAEPVKRVRDSRYASYGVMPRDDVEHVDLRAFVEELSSQPVAASVRARCATFLSAWSRMVVASAFPGGANVQNGLTIYAPPPSRFDVAYIECSNQLPLKLGIWVLFLASYYQKVLGTAAPQHPLLEAIQRTMEELIRRGEYRPGQRS